MKKRLISFCLTIALICMSFSPVCAESTATDLTGVLDYVSQALGNATIPEIIITDGQGQEIFRAAFDFSSDAAPCGYISAGDFSLTFDKEAVSLTSGDLSVGIRYEEITKAAQELYDASAADNAISALQTIISTFAENFSGKLCSTGYQDGVYTIRFDLQALYEEFIKAITAVLETNGSEVVALIEKASGILSIYGVSIPKIDASTLLLIWKGLGMENLKIADILGFGVLTLTESNSGIACTTDTGIFSAKLNISSSMLYADLQIGSNTWSLYVITKSNGFIATLMRNGSSILTADVQATDYQVLVSITDWNANTYLLTIDFSVTDDDTTAGTYRWTDKDHQVIANGTFNWNAKTGFSLSINAGNDTVCLTSAWYFQSRYSNFTLQLTSNGVSVINLDFIQKKESSRWNTISLTMDICGTPIEFYYNGARGYSIENLAVRIGSFALNYALMGYKLSLTLNNAQYSARYYLSSAVMASLEIDTNAKELNGSWYDGSNDYELYYTDGLLRLQYGTYRYPYELIIQDKTEDYPDTDCIHVTEMTCGYKNGDIFTDVLFRSYYSEGTYKLALSQITEGVESKTGAISIGQCQTDIPAPQATVWITAETILAYLNAAAE